MDRRTFVTGSVAAAAATTISGVAFAAADEAPESEIMTAEKYEKLVWSFQLPPEMIEEDQIVETITDDVIVIGSGVSGLTTAASVVGHGGSCTLFSAGTRAVSRGGSNHAVGTRTQARLGLGDYTADKVAAHFNNEISRQGYRMDSRKWWTWINESGAAMDWLTDIAEAAGLTVTLEVPYEDPNGTFTIPSGAHNFYNDSIGNSANDGEPLMCAALEEFIAANGGTITYNTKAIYLERTEERITGAIAINADGEYVRYAANKAVVLATGDYSGDPDLMAKYCNAFIDYVSPEAGDYDVQFRFGGLMPGDGQKMGLWAGAAWQNTTPSAPMIGWYGFPAPESDQNTPGILLNVEGGRFINEDTSSVYAGYAISGQTERKVFSVWDSNFAYRFDTWRGLGVNMDGLGLQPMTSDEKQAEFDSGYGTGGTYYKADTIEELLALLNEAGGIDVEAAAASIAAYNEYAKNGYDPEMHKCAEFLFPIEEGPFYGQYNQLGSNQFLCVSGGLRTSPKAEVCDANNKPIPGLYNVGCMMGDVFGTFYNFRVPGQCLGITAVTYPYLVGKALAEA